jgi:hypothetical protein
VLAAPSLPPRNAAHAPRPQRRPAPLANPRLSPRQPPDALAALKQQLQGHPGLALLRQAPGALASALHAEPGLAAAAAADPALAQLLQPDTICSMAAALEAADLPGDAHADDTGGGGEAAAAAAVGALDAALGADATARRRALLALQGHAQALAAKRLARRGGGGPPGGASLAGAPRSAPANDAAPGPAAGADQDARPAAGRRDAAWHRLQLQVEKMQQRAALLSATGALPAAAAAAAAGGGGGAGARLVSPFAALASGDDPPPLFASPFAAAAAPAAAHCHSPALGLPQPARGASAALERAPSAAQPSTGAVASPGSGAPGPLPCAPLGGLPALPPDGSAHRILSRAHSTPAPPALAGACSGGDGGAAGPLAQAPSVEWVMDIAPPTRVTTRVSGARSIGNRAHLRRRGGTRAVRLPPCPRTLAGRASSAASALQPQPPAGPRLLLATAPPLP